MTNHERMEKYLEETELWIPGGDVTMKDVVVHGLIPTCVEMANKSIENSIYEMLSLYY